MGSSRSGSAIDGIDAMHHLAMLATSVAGHPLVVSAADPAEPAWTDGHVVWIPAGASPDRARCLVVVHALVARDVIAETLRALRNRRDASSRFLLLEVARQVRTAPWLARFVELPEGVPHLPVQQAAIEQALGRAALPSVPEWWGVLRPSHWSVRRADAAGWAQDEGTRQLVDQDEGTGGEDDEESDDPTAEGERSTFLARQRSPLRSVLIGRLMNQLFGTARSRDEDGQAGGLSEARLSAARGRGVAATVHRAQQAGPGAPPAGYRVHTYPEWDSGRRGYRPDWCTVAEIVPRASPAGPPRADRALRRRLAPLALGLQKHRPVRDGEELDLDAVVDAAVRARTGDRREDVHVERVRRRRDLAVLVLLDVSGSADEGRADPSRSTHHRQRTAASSLVDAFSAVGDRVACHAFHSRGRRSVHVHAVLSFDQRWDSAAHGRLLAVRPGAYTRLGAAVRHATHVLREEGEARHRLLVVVSDGLPYDDGYVDDYAVADSQAAVREAREGGVGCVGVCLSPTQTDADLTRVFGDSGVVRLDKPEQLGRRVPTLVIHGIGKAERTWLQHTRRRAS